MPLNFAVFLDFPRAELEAAISYLFGDNLVLQEGEEPGTGVDLREDFEFANDKVSFAHLRRFLTWRHEALHFRHLSGGTLGLVNYIIGGTQYLEMVRLLGRWGMRFTANPGMDCRLPLATTRSTDEELVEIEEIRLLHGAMLATVMGGWSERKLLETAANEGRYVLEFLSNACQKTLRLPATDLPDLRADPGDAPLEPGGLTGRAVLEGLARCNEYLIAANLGVNDETLARLLSHKHHGEYSLALDLVGRRLGLPFASAVTITAHCADLALQVPLLPFLLQGRGEIDFRELLPAWRFLLLVERCKERGIGDDDFADGDGVAETLFGDLGWESPRLLARRVLDTDIPEPKALLTRHYVRCLKEGARIRLETPLAFVLPGQYERTHLLDPVYFLFPDGVIPGSTGLLTADPQYLQLFLLLIDDAVVDDILYREDLRLSTIIAKRFLELSSKDGQDPRAEAERHVHRKLELIVGKAAKERILAQTRGGSDDEDDARNLQDLTELAQSLFAGGDYAGAVQAQEKVVEIVRGILGDEDPATLAAMNNLAVMASKHGDLVRARTLQQRVRDAHVAAHGEEHELSLKSTINLASTLRSLGDEAGAQKLNAKALEIGRRCFGERDEKTLTAMSHYALGLAKAGDFEQARGLQAEVLDGRRADLGEEHPDTLRAMNNLAHTLTGMNRLEEAQALHERSLAQHRMVYGEEHAETLISMANLAEVLAETGDVSGAVDLQRTIRDVRSRNLGESHPDTLIAIESLALSLLRSGELKEARDLYEFALERREEELGSQHPSATMTAYGLYAVLRAGGEQDEAASIREEYLDWLLERDPSTLAPEQRAVRESLSQ